MDTDKKNSGTIELYDDNGNVIYKGSFMRLPLSEPLVLEKCIEFFNDKNPCFIHRSAAINRITYQLEEEMKTISSDCNQSMTWAQLTDSVKYILKSIEKQHCQIGSVVVKWI